MNDEEITYSIQLANEAERFADAIALFRLLIQQQSQLDSLQRDLLLSCCKAIINQFRMQYRKAVLYLDEPSLPVQFLTIVNKQIEKIADNILYFNKQINDLLDGILIPNSQDKKAILFYNKMKADFQRYLTEISFTEANMKQCKVYYEQCTKQMVTLDMLSQFEVLLNFSVFYYEIIGDTKQAIVIAQQAVNLTKQQPECVTPEVSELLQLLNSNIHMWQKEMNQ